MEDLTLPLSCVDGLTFKPPKAFPLTVSINGVTVVLHSNGSFEGDVEKLQEAMGNADQSYGSIDVVLWLLLREMKRS